MAKVHSHQSSGTLFVVATPIGNLEDITLRAIRTLKQVDMIAAEDTRHTRKLMTAHAIENRIISYHEHNESRRTPELIEQLSSGRSVALVSDAGTPTVSDPGYRLVQAAAAQGIPIVPIPGVSAAIAALSGAGMATDNFTFVGFPARKKSKRRDQLNALARLPHTLIFYQSPKRVASLLEELIGTMDDRPAVLARELTKIHEEFIHGTLSTILAELERRSGIKGECTLLVAGLEAAQPTDADLDAAIRQALSSPEGSALSDIAKTLAKQFKVTRKKVYDKALKIKTEDKDENPM
jgi:16S rRNA (cytidine1402-2'-O)-methyltransferase